MGCSRAFRRPAGADSEGDAIPGGGACGLPPANFPGSSRAIQKTVPNPFHSTENSGEPRAGAGRAVPDVPPWPAKTPWLAAAGVRRRPVLAVLGQTLANNGALSSGRRVGVGNCALQLTVEAPTIDDCRLQSSIATPTTGDCRVQLTIETPATGDCRVQLTIATPTTGDCRVLLTTAARWPGDSQAELPAQTPSPGDCGAQFPSAARRAGDCGALLPARRRSPDVGTAHGMDRDRPPDGSKVRVSMVEAAAGKGAVARAADASAPGAVRRGRGPVMCVVLLSTLSRGGVWKISFQRQVRMARIILAEPRPDTTTAFVIY